MTKKKKNTSQQQKQDLRHRRNEFFKRIKQVASCFGDASAIDLLGEREHALMFDCRMRPHRFINPEDGRPKISAHNLRVINRHLNHFMHHSVVNINDTSTKLSYYDFTVYGLTLYIFWIDVHENSPKIADAFHPCFPVFNNNFEATWVEVEDGVAKFQEIIGWLFSDFTKSVVRFDQEKTEQTTGVFNSRAFFSNWIIELTKGKNELLEIDGNKRTIYKVLFNNRKEIIPFTITPNQLGIKGVMQAFPLQVFIQQHAINRMKERLSEQFVHMCYLLVFHALTLEAIPLKGNRSFLFPLTYNNAKLGYLKGDILGDKLLIRTFLFVTNNGTPEGQKLHDLLGVEKADKKYLGIDKLSTFINSDIKKDKKLHELFCKAGCGDLFQLDKSLLDNPESKEIACATFLNQYLGLV